jgi:hypothetical protein
MSHSGQQVIALVLVALIMMSFWRQLLMLILSLLLAACALGLYQLAHFLHR